MQEDRKAEPTAVALTPVQSAKEYALQGLNPDDAQLALMGKRPELRRVYGFWTLCAYQIMISCSWSCLVVLYSTIFDIGGPEALVVGTICVAFGQTILMMSLAEYCTIWPTAGGQQYYTQAVSTEKLRPILSYLVGWAVMMGEISIGSSCGVNSAQIIGSFVEMTHPNFTWTRWMTWLCYCAFLIGPFILNLKPALLPGMNLLGAIWTIGGGIAWAVVFGVMAPKHDADFIFSDFINNSGYTNRGWVYIMAFYVPMYALVGTDGMMHLVEEMKDASREAPRAMVWSMVFCGITCWLSALLLLWTAGSWEEYILGSQPYMNWFVGVTKSLYGGGTFCAVIMIGLNFFVIVGNNNACSRLAWSMARDRGLPFSDYFAVVSPRFNIPLRALFAVAGVYFIIGLTVLGSDLAFQSIVSGGGILLQIGYVVPVIVVLIRGRQVLPPRPHFDLGRWGYLINFVSVGWALLTIVMFSFPLYVPVTVATIDYMNWSCIIVGATLVFPGVYWIFAARFKYIKETNSLIEDYAHPSTGVSVVAV